jgi:hypothetical protein
MWFMDVIASARIPASPYFILRLERGSIGGWQPAGVEPICNAPGLSGLSSSDSLRLNSFYTVTSSPRL